jgi:hypothetical protein
LRTVTLRLVDRRLLGTLVLSTPHSTRRITTLAFVAVDLACASADGLGVGTESVVYDVSVETDRVQFRGAMTVRGTGQLTLAAFDPLVTDFRIVATSPAGAEFTFTPANSTWATPPLGQYVSVSVIPASVSLSALQGSVLDSRNVFLVALA